MERIASRGFLNTPFTCCTCTAVIISYTPSGTDQETRRWTSMVNIAARICLFLIFTFSTAHGNVLSHLEKPICRDRTKWRYIAENSVMPEKFEIIYMSETHPHLFNFIPSPNGHLTAEGIPEYDSLYKDTCAHICLTKTTFQCRFMAFVHPYICIIAAHTNKFNTNVAFKNPFFEVPRVCLPNDGCEMVGEYFADSFSRCHFYQCAPAGYNSLKATQHRCPHSTITRDSFLTSRNEKFFTQPCSQFGTDCMRPFPLFAP